MSSRDGFRCHEDVLPLDPWPKESDFESAIEWPGLDRSKAGATHLPDGRVPCTCTRFQPRRKAYRIHGQIRVARSTAGNCPRKAQNQPSDGMTATRDECRPRHRGFGPEWPAQAFLGGG